MKKRTCELCGGAAAVHCAADAAYMCWRCDAHVHGANFLAARHVRRASCTACGAVTGRRLSGAGSAAAPHRSLCPSCSEDLSPASSSSCVSTAETSAAEESKRAAAARSAAAAGTTVGWVLARWAWRVGLVKERRCAGMASHVLATCGREMSVLPLRVALAAALWHAIKECGEGGGRAEGSSVGRHAGRACEAALRRLEACAGVPARLIILAEARLARAVRRARVQPKEGWAECS